MILKYDKELTTALRSLDPRLERMRRTHDIICWLDDTPFWGIFAGYEGKEVVVQVIYEEKEGKLNRIGDETDMQISAPSEKVSVWGNIPIEQTNQGYT